ncbi:MAG: type II toxin-antitoxin system VapC family toxin [Cytophagales bacterium]|nr:type II toxin-antitoxin system VapC family toxin [Cytophagales bacterium]
MLIDSDVLIWLLRGNAHAAQTLEALPAWSISAVTYMELVQGCRSRTELKAMQKAFRATPNEVLPLTEAISQRACDLVDAYTLAHGLQMADSLIAATALENGLPLLTGNAKHFKAIAGLEVRAFKVAG